jgi:DNA-binding NarL/FixJ family response regulator
MSYRLLVVAGEHEILRALPDQLGADFEVQLIETANAALWEVKSDPPQVILAAVDLPEMSGLEMAEILPNFDVPTRVLLWSHTPNQSVRQKAESYGIFRFLDGNLSPDELHIVLHEAIQAAQAAEPSEDSIATETSESESPAPAPEPEPPPPAPAEHFTPARVRLPSRSASPLTSGERLAARVRAEAAIHAAPPAEQSKPAASQPTRRRDGPLVLTADNLNPIRSIMSQLSQELGAQCIMLTDRAGMVLVEVGSTDKLPVMILLPLLSTSFSTAGEVARQLHEEDATTLYIHEGINYDLYCFDVLQRFLLVLVFNKKVASSKIGAVWVNTKRAIRELRDVLG